MATLQQIPLPLRSAGDESFEQELGYLSVNGSSISGVSGRSGRRGHGVPVEGTQPVSASTAGMQLPASKAEDLLVEKALPPIKTRRDANDGGSAAPELSPPPSPKRMRELVRKTSLKNLAFSPVRTQDDSV